MSDKFNQERYIKLRNKMIEANENVVDNMYLDTRAVPTISAGVALIERGEDKRWHVNSGRVAKLADMLNLTQEENEILSTSLNKQEIPKNFINQVDNPFSQIKIESEAVKIKGKSAIKVSRGMGGENTVLVLEGGIYEA